MRVTGVPTLIHRFAGTSRIVEVSHEGGMLDLMFLFTSTASKFTGGKSLKYSHHTTHTTHHTPHTTQHTTHNNHCNCCNIGQAWGSKITAFVMAMTTFSGTLHLAKPLRNRRHCDAVHVFVSSFITSAPKAVYFPAFFCMEEAEREGREKGEQGGRV